MKRFDAPTNVPTDSKAAPAPQKVGIVLRVLAFFLFLASVVPSALLAAQLAQGHLPPTFDLSDACDFSALAAALFLMGGLPAVSLVLLGIGTWQRSWALSLAGLLVMVSGLALVTVITLRI